MRNYRKNNINEYPPGTVYTVGANKVSFSPSLVNPVDATDEIMTDAPCYVINAGFSFSTTGGYTCEGPWVVVDVKDYENPIIINADKCDVLSILNTSISGLVKTLNVYGFSIISDEGNLTVSVKANFYDYSALGNIAECPLMEFNDYSQSYGFSNSAIFNDFSVLSDGATVDEANFKDYSLAAGISFISSCYGFSVVSLYGSQTADFYQASFGYVAFVDTEGLFIGYSDRKPFDTSTLPQIV